MDLWNKKRTIKKAKELVNATKLNLKGLHLYTEAGSGYYSITALVATIAGAKSVHCVAKNNRFNTAEDAINQTNSLLQFYLKDLTTSTKVSYSEGHDYDALKRAHIVTNSNPLRPLDRYLLEKMNNNSVVGLMYEPWEFRGTDIDLDSARALNIWVVGANEMHDSVKCFYSAGVLLLKGMLNAGLEVYSNRVLLICRNRFVNYILPMLSGCCERIDFIDENYYKAVLPCNVQRVDLEQENKNSYDAILMMDNSEINQWNIAKTESSLIPKSALGNWDVCVQAMGDIKREDFKGVKFFPEIVPPRGYMGMNPGSLGVDLVLRNYIAGIKATEEAWDYLKTRITFDKVKDEYFEWIKLIEY